MLINHPLRLGIQSLELSAIIQLRVCDFSKFRHWNLSFAFKDFYTVLCRQRLFFTVPVLSLHSNLLGCTMGDNHLLEEQMLKH